VDGAESLSSAALYEIVEPCAVIPFLRKDAYAFGIR
jgi:hypothetical protein